MSRTVSTPSFDAKDPAETVDVGFDFASLVGGVVSTAVVSIDVYSGTEDPAPASMLVGVPIVAGAVVVQRVLAGLAGANYLLRCTATADDGQVFVLAGVLPVRPAVA